MRVRCAGLPAAATPCGIIGGVPRPSPSRSLHDLSRAELAALLVELGEPRYRADQLWSWLYRHWTDRPADMSNIPARLRDRLEERFPSPALRLASRSDSEDGLATKLLFRLTDGHMIETVLMHYVDAADEVHAGETTAARLPGASTGRHTICISTQAGCAMGCVFCATGQMGLVRDLSRGECVAQVAWCARALAESGQRISNVVFMGMGEPLANWCASWGTVETLADGVGARISPRRRTVSTVGLVPGIRRLSAAGLPVRLAVSLHAPDDSLRSALVPINDLYPLADVIASCREYQARGGRRLTFEYVLIADVNDRPEQARALARLLRGLRAHVNLIPLNPTAGTSLRPSRTETADKFARALTDAGVGATLRSRRGIEIQAGCGQLRSRASTGLVGRTVSRSPERPVRGAGGRRDAAPRF
jgi:23S rRNA (adenine2503-C2)-methyltransferase